MRPAARAGRRRPLLGLIALAVTATACATNAPQDTLRPKGPEARYIDHLFFPVFWIAMAVLALVGGLAIYAMAQFRERTGDERPQQVHGNTKLEFTWSIIPLLLLLGVGIASVVGVFHLYENPKGQRIAFAASSDPVTPPVLTGNVLEVHVIGHRWWWEFDYPGLGTGQDQFLEPGEKPQTALVTAGELHVPAGTKVHLTITANEPAKSPEGVGPGVMHNFWVPALAGKIYAVPGRLTHLNLEADSKQITDGHPLTYKGQCSEYCGLSHANMRLTVVAQSGPDFAAWVANQQEPATVFGDAERFADPTAAAGYTLFNGSAGCATCHSVTGTPASGQVGPSLTHLAARSVFAGAIFELNDNNLRTWLRNPQTAKPGANMRIRKLTEDEITKVIAYLDTLK